MYNEQIESLQNVAAMSQTEVRQLRMELMNAVKNHRITEIMMSEYGAMAMGARYMENKGYHDSEMHAYALRRWENVTEVQALDQVLEERRDSPMRGPDRAKNPRTSQTS